MLTLWKKINNWSITCDQSIRKKLIYIYININAIISLFSFLSLDTHQNQITLLKFKNLKFSQHAFNFLNFPTVSI